MTELHKLLLCVAVRLIDNHVLDLNAEFSQDFFFRNLLQKATSLSQMFKLINDTIFIRNMV